MTTIDTPSEEDWSAIDRAFDRALDLEGEARERFLASLSAELKQPVKALLNAAGAPGPLDSGVYGVAGQLLLETEERLDPMIDGRRVGPYRLVERLGAGGMGVVYLAERADGEYEHRVALKVVRWELAEPELIRRFRNERQVLASLSHPNIATLLDGGMTEEGLPYLVLETVEGWPIDVYCEDHDLDLAARVELLETVCRAVDFAHRRLVVHRDLKPTNILVRSDGVPKLVDFGVAKLLEGAAGADTHTRFAPLTPRYAAPEQRSGGTASVAADVWSLGVVLYELLSGERPFGDLAAGQGPDEPPPPSRVSGKPELKGDLDNIITNTLRAEPERRYRTASELADDLERWRLGRPVHATPSTWGYRLRKLVGRHRVASAAVLVAHLAAVIGLGGILWQAREARIERDLAQTEAARAEQVTGFLEGLFASAQPRLGGEPSVRDLLDEGARQINRELVETPDVQARLMGTLATSYVQLGDNARAEELLSSALEIQGSLGEERHEFIQTLTSLGGVHHWSGRTAEAEKIFLDALERLRRLDKERPHQEAGILHSLGMARAAQGDWDAAAELYRVALEKYGTDASDEIAMVRANLAASLTRLGRLEEAEAEHRAAIAHYREFDPSNLTVATVLNNLALNLGDQGRLDEAVEVLEESRELRRSLPQGHPDLAASDANLAAFMISAGRPDGAVGLARSATDLLEGSSPSSPPWIGARANLGWALAQTGELEEAERWLTEVVGDCSGAYGDTHRVTARARTLLGELRRRQGRSRDAERVLARAVSDLAAAQAQPEQQAHALVARGAVLCDLGRAAEGLESINTGRELMDDQSQAWRLAEIEIERARCLRSLDGSWNESGVAEARENLTAIRGPDAWVTRRAEGLF